MIRVQPNESVYVKVMTKTSKRQSSGRWRRRRSRSSRAVLDALNVDYEAEDSLSEEIREARQA